MDSKLCRFNTVSGKRCYFITFVFPSLRSGTRDVRTSSSLHSSAASHPSSHTASGKHCCNIALNVLFISQMKWGFNTASGRHCCNTQRNKSQTFRYNAVVSIPQAVGAIATLNGKPIMMPILLNKYNNRGDYHVVQSYYARNTNIAYYDLLLGGDLIYINKERLSNNPKNQPPWLGGIKLIRSFINSIPNEKDLDKLRK